MLRPSRRTNEIIRFCLADAARRTGVIIHAVCFMSNHWHGVVTDPEARLPEFLERFHRLLARAQNAAIGRWENLWSSEKTSVVVLESDQDVLDKMAYTIANPTAAGLVSEPSEWPGVISLGLNDSCVVQRPDIFFAVDGCMPTQVTLKITRPRIFEHLDDAALELHLKRAIEQRVSAARAALLADGRKFLGVAAVLRQPFEASPSSVEPRRTNNPRVAAKKVPLRKQALRALSDFVRQYRVAWDAWRSGLRETIFPAGTYALRVHARVACAPACPA